MAGTSGDTRPAERPRRVADGGGRDGPPGHTQRNPKLAALAVAGSVGSGLADQFSDLELDCYWFSAPGDPDRTGPIHALGGDLTALWDYDQDDEEWSEDYRLGELDVTVSNFLTDTIERFLDEVVEHADTDPVKHMRLAALQRSPPAARRGADGVLAGAGRRIPGRARLGLGGTSPEPPRCSPAGRPARRSSPGATISRSRPC